MSTRVQKGSTVFKPIAKGRPRVTDHSRQVSSTPDSQGFAARAASPPLPSASVTASPLPEPAKSTSGPGNNFPAVSTRGDASPSLEEMPTSASYPQSAIIVVDPSLVLPMVDAQTTETPAQLPTGPHFIHTHTARPMPTPHAVASSPSRSTPAPPFVLPSQPKQQPQPTSTSQSMSERPPSPMQSSLVSTTSAPIPILTPSSESSTQAYPTARTFIFPAQLHANVEHPPEGHSLDSSPFPAQKIDFARIIEEAAMADNAENHASHPSSIPEDFQSTTVPSPSLRMQLDSGSIIKPTRPRRKQASSALAEEERSDGADTTTTKPVRRRRQKSVDGQLDVEPPTVPQRSKRRRRIHKTTAEDDSDGADSDSKKKKRRRKSTSISRSQQGRTESVAPFDADADPGEELDPTVVRMADLCEDTGQGRISSKAAQIFENHTAWKRSNRERRSRMKVIMEAKKYGRNEDDTNGPAPVPEIAGPIVDGTPEAGPSKSRSPSHVVQVQDGDGTHSDDGLDGFDYSQAVATSKFNVQVRIGPNGETIVDEESLFVDRGEEAETGDYTHVEESDATKFVNSATYGKKYRGSRWSAEETELFYDALSQFGENYELISYVLPGRDRKSCKNKFKSEDKRDPKRITHCLNNRVPYDMQTLSRMTGKDFSGPTPVIRAKTPPNLAQMDVDGSPTSVQNQKSGQGDAVDETVSPSSLKRSSSGPPSHKKKGKRKEDDGVEVLGAADGIWD